jgi:hypothetical protein
MGHLSVIIQQWDLQICSELNFLRTHKFIYRLTVLTKFQIKIKLNFYILLTLAYEKP